jgi:peptide deformylase
MVRKILLLGDKQLYKVSDEVDKKEIRQIRSSITDLHDTLMNYRDRYGAGRAIAAPQIGIQKRIIYMYLDHAVVFINPVLKFPDNEMVEILDDCMSFPGLYVRVMRHKRCTIEFMDLDWNLCSWELEGDLAELLQHECDHLDGILATMRAIDNKSFVFKDVLR